MATSGSCHIMKLPTEMLLKIGEEFNNADFDPATRVCKRWRGMFLKNQFRRVYFDNSQKQLELQLREFIMDRGSDKNRLRQSIEVATIIVRGERRRDWTSFTNPKASSAQTDDETLPSLMTEALVKMTSLGALKLHFDNLTYEQSKHFVSMLLETDVLSRLHRTRLIGPTRLVASIVDACDVSKLKALHIQGWVDSPAYTAARKFKGLQKLHLHYDTPAILHGAPLMQDTTMIFFDFKHLKWLVLSEAEYNRAQTDGTGPRGDDHLRWVVTRIITGLKSSSTLERFATSIRHTQFELDVIRSDWSLGESPLHPDEIASWYEEIVGCVMEEVPTLQEFWIMDEYPYSYSGTRVNDEEVTFERHTSAPPGSILDLLD